jgi:hypothetical protein
MKVINIWFKILLVWLVAFSVATLWVDKNTPTLQQIKNEKYAETLSWISQSKEIELKARADQKEWVAKKQKIIQWLYVCVDFDTEKVTYIDIIEWFRLSDDCQKTPCRAKDSLRCTLND